MKPKTARHAISVGGVKLGEVDFIDPEVPVTGNPQLDQFLRLFWTRGADGVAMVPDPESGGLADGWKLHEPGSGPWSVAVVESLEDLGYEVEDLTEPEVLNLLESLRSDREVLIRERGQKFYSDMVRALLKIQKMESVPEWIRNELEELRPGLIP